MSEVLSEAPRLRPPGWKDPRLIIGFIVVALSVAGVVALVQSADSRQGYWAASVDVVPGATVHPDDFHIVQASMSESGEQYWLATRDLPAEFYISSTILQGEFLPQRQVVEADPAGRQQAGVRVSEDMPTSVKTGSRVDVWVALPREDGRGFEDPTRMITQAEVVGIADNTSAFAAEDTTTVYLMLSQDVVPEVLSAQANNAKISLIPSTNGD